MEEEKRISEEELKKDVAAAEARIRKTDDFTSPEELYGELIASVKKYHPSDDISLIEKAYRVAADAHKDQKRKSGEPYIIHPLCVAIILADLELDKESIAAGLLHDVVEDTVMTEEELTEEFGPCAEILRLCLSRAAADGDRIKFRYALGYGFEDRGALRAVCRCIRRIFNVASGINRSILCQNRRAYAEFRIRHIRKFPRCQSLFYQLLFYFCTDFLFHIQHPLSSIPLFFLSYF